MICSVLGCGDSVTSRGWCEKHYARWRRRGDPVAPYLKPGNRANCYGTPLERIRKRLLFMENGCWKYIGAKKEAGYPVIRITENNRAKNFNVGRVLYEDKHGPVSLKLDLDHFKYPQDGCIGPECCNPDHLVAVTHRANSLRSDSPPAINARRTECLRGHSFTEENTYRRPSRHGRECRECIRIRQYQ